MNQSISPSGQDIRRTKARALTEAITALLLYYGISLLSRLVAPLFLLVVGVGLFFPLLWGIFSRDWKNMGFTRQNAGRAMMWGLGSGALLMVVIWFTTEHKLAPFFALQLMVGIPIWLLVMSPFQEFFFRGWLQPRFEKSLGLWPGIIIAAIGFAVWHLCPPFEQAQIVPIWSVYGMAFTTIMGLVFGYIFHRTGNILAPWLAHVLAGLTLAGLFFGFLADRKDHKLSLEICWLLSALALVLAIIAPIPSWFFAIFFLSGAVSAGPFISGISIVYEFTEAENRPTYIGLANTIPGVAVSLAPLIGGWLAGAMSYRAMFILAAILGAVSWVLLRFAVREPREMKSSP